MTQTISIVSTFKTLLTSCLEDTLHHQHSMHLFGYISHTHTKSSSSRLRLFNFFFFCFSVSLTIEWWEQFSNLNSSAKYSGQRTHYLTAHTHTLSGQTFGLCLPWTSTDLGELLRWPRAERDLAKWTNERVLQLRLDRITITANKKSRTVAA